MTNNVLKRNGTVVAFDENKIVTAVMKAQASLGDEHINETEAKKIKTRVIKKLKTWGTETPHVDLIHTLVEHSLMDAKMYDLAREYITYRDMNKPDIFRKRTNVLPYEYPELMDYVDAINHAYWLRDEFNVSPDVQDIKINLSEKEREAALRAMLAISQIESAVKKFWGRIGDRMPKPEVESVGATFAESEVRHERAYSKLVEQLGLFDEFEKLKSVPCINSRIKYLEKVNKNIRAVENKDFFETIILFSMFVENVSLFSQFFILMSFNKHKNNLKGISNTIEATSKEENVHAMFGFELVNIIKDENPDWFDESLIEHIKEISYEAFEAEKEVVEWIYEKGDLEVIPKDVVLEYIKFRINNSLKAIGITEIFGVDESAMDTFEWFDDEVSVSKNNDNFNKRNTAYKKMSKSISEDDLF